MHFASKDGHVAAVQALLSKDGCDIDTAHLSCGLAAENGHAEVVKELIRRKADIETTHDDLTPLYLAIYHERISVVKVLAEAKTNLSTECNGPTALHFACQSNKNCDIIDFLLRQGANTEMDGNNGTKTLNIAAEHGQPMAALSLLHAGARVGPAAFGSWTPLHFAAINGSFEVVDILIKYGADRDCKMHAPYDGCAPLHRRWVLLP